MNDILIVAVVTMISCLIINITSLFYGINEIRKIEIKLKKLEANFDIMKQNYIELKKFETEFNVIKQHFMDGYFNALLKIYGDDGK